MTNYRYVMNIRRVTSIHMITWWVILGQNNCKEALREALLLHDMRTETKVVDRAGGQAGRCSGAQEDTAQGDEAEDRARLA